MDLGLVFTLKKSNIGQKGRREPPAPFPFSDPLNLLLLIILILCKNWTYVKFSGDYTDFAHNFIILITDALWEICYRTFNFL